MNVPPPGGWPGLSGLGAELVSRLKASLSIGQSTRLIQLETPLDSGTLVVERFTLTEGVHADEPLWAELDCISTNAHLELKALVGEQVTLRLMLADGTWRNWHGYVAQAGQMGSDGGLGSYRLQLAAFTHWLKQRRDTRIFQDATSADIVSQVLSAYPQARFKLEVADPGPLHEITTQYRETDWAFVTRLMAREGWSWRIDHEGHTEGALAGARAARHTLVIVDQHAQRPDLGGLRFSRPDLRGVGPGGLLAALAQAFNLSTGQARDTITAWRVGQEVGTNAVTLAAWDEHQLAGVTAQSTLLGSGDVALGKVPALEHYNGQGERRFADGRVGTPQPASSKTADARAQALMAAHQLRQFMAGGQGAVRTLRPGAVFQITEHSLYGPGVDNAFCALSITHEAANNLGQQAAQILQRTDIEQGSYRNEFAAAPAHLRLVPPPVARPTAPGPQTAVVMAAPGEPLSTDRDHRIRIQFGWQRGTQPLAGGLAAPKSPSGVDTGHAPGSDHSGTWVRVAQGVAGPNWGAVFTPRAGTEVLVEYLDGDIDRPVVVGQLHNGQNDLPWPAGVGSGADHPGTISGWHSHHLDGQGANQWLVDDANGQLRMRLLSHSRSTGHSELTLGHLITQSAHGGPGHARRGSWLGEGFYAYTDGWAVARASQGLLLSTSARQAQGASVDSTQMDAREAVDQLTASRHLGAALSQSARQQGAQGLATHDANQALQQHTDAMDPRAQGKHEGAVGGQEPRKAQAGARTLADPVERFARPQLHLDTPANATWVTPTSISAFSGQDTSLTTQGDIQLTSAHTLSAVSGQTTSLYTHDGGIKAITANADLSLRAHTDAMQIWADQDITLQSTTDEIRIQARDSIAINAGQSQVLIKGGDVTFTCPGTWTVKGATHDWMGGGSGGPSLMTLPSGTQRTDGISTPLAQAYGQSISLEEVPSEWLPRAIARQVRVTKQGEQVAEVAIARRDIFSEPLMFDHPADVQLWLHSSPEWQVSEDVKRPDDVDDEEEGEDVGEQ